MPCKKLSNRQGKRIAPLLPAERGQGRPYVQSHRTTVAGDPQDACSAAPRRDLPPQFGNWSAGYNCFTRWVKSGVFDAVFASLPNLLNPDVVMVDGTFVKVHRHGTGAPKEDARPTTGERRKPSASVVVG